MKKSTVLGMLIAAAIGTVVHAHEFKLGAITIGHPYARTTVAGQPTGGAYLKLDNQGANDKLIAVSAPIARSAELHTMKMEGNVMRMREVASIELPSGRTVELKPGGQLHIMLVGLKAPLNEGDSFPLKLSFEKAGDVTVTVKVESAPDAAAMVHDHASAMPTAGEPGGAKPMTGDHAGDKAMPGEHAGQGSMKH